MAHIRADEIRGYQFENQTVCPECATKEELENLKLDEILTEDDIEKVGDLYFCDRCKEGL